MGNIMKSLYISLMAALLLMPLSIASAAKKPSPEHVTGATTVNTAEAKKLFDDGAIFLDVRSNRDWEAGRIPGSKHLELKKVYNQESLAEIANPQQKLVIYCNSTGCSRSSKASAKAVGWNYKNIYYYRLGFPDWQTNGYAIE